MRRLIVFLSSLAVSVGLAALVLIGQPSQATAGGLPCFLCHGVNFEGSDLAPRVAGTKLTDAEIISQVRKPRGVMPSFSQSEFSDEFIIRYIRSLPTGQPTLALPAQQRSAALATISAVAAARATAFAQTASSSTVATPTALRPTATMVTAINTPTPLHPTATIVAAIDTPTPVDLAAAAAATNVAANTNSPTATSPTTASPSPLGVFIVTGGLLAVIAGLVWKWQHS